MFSKGYYALERCEKVLIEKEYGSANYSSALDETGCCAQGSLCLELNAKVLRKLANCSSALCALEQASTEKEFFLVKYIQEYLMNENLQGPNNFRLI